MCVCVICAHACVRMYVCMYVSMCVCVCVCVCMTGGSGGGACRGGGGGLEGVYADRFETGVCSDLMWLWLSFDGAKGEEVT